MVNEGLTTAEQARGAGADATDGGEVGVMEDGQRHGETAPHAGRRKQHQHQLLLKLQ